MEEGLDLNHPDVFKVLEADGWNGFGFQCDQSEMYIAQIFHGTPRPYRGFPNGSCHMSKTDGRYDIDIFIEKLRERLTLTKQEVWMTDFVGHNFLTVSVQLYRDIPKILNATLELDYKFTTHANSGNLKILFEPGETFSRINFEKKLIKDIDVSDEEFRFKKMYIRACLLHWNWATPEGREFCTQLRARLHKKPRSAKLPRMCWPKYNATVTKYKILHIAGWCQYEPDVDEEPLQKKIKTEITKEEIVTTVVIEEFECMVCLDALPTTTVMPCGHRVVCDNCSEGLRATPDDKICTQCRCKITHVFYKKENYIEIK
jgi:hypothetical protein